MSVRRQRVAVRVNSTEVWYNSPERHIVCPENGELVVESCGYIDGIQSEERGAAISARLAISRVSCVRSEGRENVETSVVYDGVCERDKRSPHSILCIIQPQSRYRDSICSQSESIYILTKVSIYMCIYIAEARKL